MTQKIATNMLKNNKTEQLLVYLIKKHQEPSITSLMKLVYLIDLISVKRFGEKISDFEYKRYNFGPFDENIYKYLELLNWSNIIKAQPKYSLNGEEYLTYVANEEIEKYPLDKISKKEFELIDEFLESVSGFGAKTLTDIAYKTKPMKELGATLGGNENMGIVLDLFTAKK